MKAVVNRHWPLLVAVAMLWGTVGKLFVDCLSGNAGKFVYVLDDVYIHLAIAKNFSQYGVWGITPYEFSSSTSSMLWPLLLSLIFRLFGPNEITPLILNVLFATVALCAAYAFMKKYALPSGYSFLFLLWLVFLTPLPAIIFTGMEHTLQVSVTIPFVYLAAQELASESGRSSKRDTFLLFVLAGFATLVRYEGLFLAGAVFLLLAARQRWRIAAGVGAAAILPVALYGSISAAKGWFWLPNSVLLKANVPLGLRARGIGAASYARDLWSWETAPITASAVALLVLFVLRVRRTRKFWDARLIMIVIFVMVTALHLKFAGVGWFFRYEAYLIALGSLILFSTVCDYLNPGERIERDRKATLEALAAVALILLPFGPLVARGIVSFLVIPVSSKNIHDQQYQMGLFVKEFYGGVPAAANDVGCVSYLGTSPLLDLMGLADLEVARWRIKDTLRSEQIDDLAQSRAVKIAMVYERGFEGYIAYGGAPRTWIKVGSWTIKRNFTCPDDTVSFFAVDPSEESRLITNLRLFSSRLPSDVIQSGRYLNSETRAAQSALPLGSH